MDPGENAFLASQLIYKKFKLSLIILLRQFQEGWYVATTQTLRKLSLFLQHFSKKNFFSIYPTIIFSEKFLLRNHDFILK